LSRIEIERFLLGPEPVTWVFAGDSITHGAVYTYGARSYSEHFHERVRWELGRLTDLVLNTAVSSYTCTDLLRRFDDLVTRFAPTVVSVMLGTNDAVDGLAGLDEYRRNLLEIIHRIEAAGAIALLETPPAADLVEATNIEHVARYVDEMLKVGAEKDVAVVDHYSYWMELGSGQTPRWLLDDAIHPNAEGHLALALKVFDDLGMVDPASPTCQLAITTLAAAGETGQAR
jgi:lysophospholipase L1-like esterase